MSFEITEEETRVRALDKMGRTIRVIPLIKTMPFPSSTYEETVCVAGVAQDPDRWVRLYPINFRKLESGSQFRKYEPIQVEVEQPRSDNRPESVRVTAAPSIEGDVIDGWNLRYEIIASLPERTLCSLQKDIEANIDAQSLAAVRSVSPPALQVSFHSGWTSEQRGAMEKWAQEDLFGNVAKPLDPPRFSVKLKFSCLEPDCKGHTIGLIDWEARALERRWGECDLDYARQEFTEKFINQKFKPGQTTLILVGNQGSPQRRRSFLALGFFGPFDDPINRLF